MLEILLHYETNYMMSRPDIKSVEMNKNCISETDLSEISKSVLINGNLETLSSDNVFPQ